MSKRKLSIIIIALALILIATSYVVNNRGTIQAGGKDQPQGDSTQKPKEPVLVVPENPLGVLGMISAFVAGLGMFIITKKRK